jgi:CMP-N,N'-diacetyllegionaminic acid synthase
MIRGRPLTAVVPARGGSKGIPQKNLYRVGCKSLIERAADLAKGCSLVDSVYVSTDDARMYALAKANGYATPVPRPPRLADDGARTVEVIRDLVETGVLPADGCLLLLQPTSPLRTSAELKAICQLLDENWADADMVVSVSAIDGPNPYKAQVVENGYLRPLLNMDAAVPRQSLPRAFLPNGAFYLGKTDVLLAQDSFMLARSLPFIMGSLQSVNLDGPMDLLLLEAVLAKGLFRLDDGATSLSAP